MAVHSTAHSSYAADLYPADPGCRASVGPSRAVHAGAPPQPPAACRRVPHALEAVVGGSAPADGGRTKLELRPTEAVHAQRPTTGTAGTTCASTPWKRAAKITLLTKLHALPRPSPASAAAATWSPTTGAHPSCCHTGRWARLGSWPSSSSSHSLGACCAGLCAPRLTRGSCCLRSPVTAASGQPAAAWQQAAHPERCRVVPEWPMTSSMRAAA